MPQVACDVVVIGAAPIGENLADRVVKGGPQAILSESELAGGTCAYFACVPSQALRRSSAALVAARRVAGARQAVPASVAAEAVLERRARFTGG